MRPTSKTWWRSSEPGNSPSTQSSVISNGKPRNAFTPLSAFCKRFCSYTPSPLTIEPLSCIEHRYCTGTHLHPTTASPTAAAPLSSTLATTASRFPRRSSSCSTTKAPTTCVSEAFANHAWATGACSVPNSSLPLTSLHVLTLAAVFLSSTPRPRAGLSGRAAWATFQHPPATSTTPLLTCAACTMACMHLRHGAISRDTWHMYTEQNTHFIKDGVDFWWNDEGETMHVPP